jgi:hypothetical protein
VEETEMDFIFIQNLRNVKKNKGNFSLHKNAIIIAQKLAATSNTNFLFSVILFNSFMSSTSTVASVTLLLY